MDPLALADWNSPGGVGHCMVSANLAAPSQLLLDKRTLSLSSDSALEGPYVYGAFR